MGIVRKAVFPIAGLGTRFLPATKASPKEMLSVVDKPLIQYAVEEAYKSGIRQMIFVTGRTKRSIEDHFDTAHELELELQSSGKNELLALVRSIKPDDMQCVYVRQPRALGLGHAVLCARDLVGDEPFAVLLADDLMVGKTPILKQMINQYNERQTSILAVEEVPIEKTGLYGIVTGTSLTNTLFDVSGIIEKPSPETTPSTLAVAGRYILTPAIFDEIVNQVNNVTTGEIQLTNSISTLLLKEKVFAYRFQGIRYDCGSKLGFLRATVDLAERHPEVSAEFGAWLAQRNSIIQE